MKKLFCTLRIKKKTVLYPEKKQKVPLGRPQAHQDPLSAPLPPSLFLSIILRPFFHSLVTRTLLLALSREGEALPEWLSLSYSRYLFFSLFYVVAVLFKFYLYHVCQFIYFSLSFSPSLSLFPFLPTPLSLSVFSSQTHCPSTSVQQGAPDTNR